MDTTLCLMKLSGDTLFKYQGALSDYTPEEYALIEWLDERPRPTWEELEAVWPEVEADLARAATIQEIESTDAGFIRFSEDLANVLIEKGVIALEDLPQAAIDKLNARTALRASLSE